MRLRHAVCALRALVAFCVGAGLLFASDPGRAPSPRQPAPAFPPPFTGGPLFPRPFTHTAPRPVEIVVADWNGDGVSDLAIPGLGGPTTTGGPSTNGEISLFLARGDGTFQRQSDITSPTYPQAGAAADFNGDARPDLLIADQLGFALVVYPGNGSGGFGAPIGTPSSRTVHALAVADLDGDAKVDVVVAHTATNQIGVLPGLGNARFGTEVLYPTCVAPGDLALDDLDRDGDPDLAVACAGTFCSTPGCSDPGGSVGVHLNAGDGALSAPMIVAEGRHFGSIGIGDFLGDGGPDIVASTVRHGGGLAAGMDLVDGDGAAGFAPPIEVDAGATTTDLAVTDLNGDGRPEVVGLSSPFPDDYPQPRNLRTWTAGVGGGLVLLEDRDLDHQVARLAVGRFNQDGSADLVVAASDFGGNYEESLETYLGHGDGRLVVEECVASGRDLSALALRDLNHDGLTDIVGLDASEFSAQDPSLRVLLARRDGRYEETRYPLPDSDSSRMVIEDFDGDGESDAAVLLRHPSNAVRMFRGVGDGTLVPVGDLWTSSAPIGMAAGHLDGDELMDLAILTSCADVWCYERSVALYTGSPDSFFEGPRYTRIAAPFNLRELAVGDFDADGLDEVVVTSGLSAPNESFRYRVEPGWSLTWLGPVLNGGLPLETLDINGDSIDDLRHGQIILLGRAGSGLDRTAPFLSGPAGFTVADLNSDGVPDPVLAGWPGHFRLTARFSDGVGGFLAPAEFLWSGPGTTHTALAAADMNGDGRTDIVFTGQQVCIAHNLSGVPDLDHDGLSDTTDPCVDPDDDGHADRLTPSTTCPPDNCIGIANAGQTDSDTDGLGDACDVCPQDPANDADRDGVCGAVDRCPGARDDTNADADGDGIGDACDVCPSTADPTQADADHDGSGDACQPVAALSLIQDGSSAIEAQVLISDPQHEPLSTRLRLTGPPRNWRALNLFGQQGDLCGREYSILPPEIGGPGGIIFGSELASYASFADSDLALMCDDGNPDYQLALGPCARIVGRFDNVLDIFFSVPPAPISICIARAGQITGFLDLTILGSDENGVTVADAHRRTHVDLVLPPTVATSIPLEGLTPGVTYSVEIEVTDGHTHPVQRSREFVHQGETALEVTFDADRDGVFDGDDPCVDQDADGWRDPAYPGSCGPDNCPQAANPGQEDADADLLGDTCDPCTDRDGDGLGDPGFAANACPEDNCAQVPNPEQADTDADLIGNACDTCTDSDHDGFGDAAIAPSACEIDNCRQTTNPDQADFDADLVGDVCDNCPATANAQQEDENADGSGDACQPRVVIDGIATDGEGNLVASGRMTDPQGESLHGTISFAGNGIAPFTLYDALVDSDCSRAHLPDGIPRVGIGYANASIGVPVLFDLDFAMSCDDGRPDYRLARGACGAPTSPFDTTLFLDPSEFPMPLCVRGYSESSGGQTLFVEAFDGESAMIRGTGVGPIISVLFDGSLPDSVPLDGLYPGETYVFDLEVTDGNTVPRSASAGFPYLGEAEMLLAFNSGPRASIMAAPSTECAGASLASVTLDGTGSTDPDSSPGTQDDIASYDWYQDYGTPGERSLGSGAVLQATLGLGSHSVTLKVTDQAGEISTATTTVAVVDTQAPLLDCPAATPAAECSGAGGAYVTLGATAHDVCGGTVTLTNDRTAGLGDASGAYPLGSTSVVFSADDGRGNSATCTTAVSVVDTRPPTLSVLTDPGSLWPPNHEMVPVGVQFAAADACGAGVHVELMSVTNSEPDDAPGGDDGQTSGDVQNATLGSADAIIDLRAERGGKGAGRTYTLTYRAIDLAGHATTALGIVTVPHDQGQGPEPLLQRAERAGPNGELRLYWPAVPGATSYDLIRGDLNALRAADGILHLGTVEVLARGTTETSVTEPSGPDSPPVDPPMGGAWFYLIQQTTERGAVGYGTESAPWPRLPDECTGGCPGAPEIAATPGGSTPTGTGSVRKR